MFASFMEEGFHSRIGIRPATSHDHILAIQWPGVYGCRRSSTLLPDCTKPNATAVQQSHGWRIDHTHDRPALFDQRDVDSELVIALDEFARAIERINQPVLAPLRAQDRKSTRLNS